MLNISQKNSYILVKNIAKVYPNKVKIYEFKKEFIVTDTGLQTIKKMPKPKQKSESEGGDSLFRSKRRTKTKIQDLCLSNEFNIFATFTFRNDRQNVDKCKTILSQWLNNQQRIHGKFEYLIVPEFHKDGKSIHFHALLQNYKGKLIESCNPKKQKTNKLTNKLTNQQGVPSPHHTNIQTTHNTQNTYCTKKHKHTPVYQNNKKVYNIRSFKHGFTNATYIQNKDKTASYIRKYITKEMPQFSGKKRYWASKGLKRPQIVHNYDFRSNTLVQHTLVYQHKNFDVYEQKATVQTYSEYKKSGAETPL